MFLKLGEERDLSKELMKEPEALTCLLYAPKINQLRSMTTAITRSVQRKVRSKANNFHPAGTPCRNTQRANYNDMHN